VVLLFICQATLEGATVEEWLTELSFCNKAQRGNLSPHSHLGLEPILFAVSPRLAPGPAADGNGEAE
jgi:hypothetical protein